MKNTYWILIVLALVLSACSGSSTPTTLPGDTYVSPNLNTSYEGALSARNLLALGTLQLEGTAQEITPEQAAQLVPLWQALRSTDKIAGTADEEMNALLGQIEGGLTGEQIAAINGMALTQTDFQEWMQANGVSVGTGGSQPGAGRSMSPEQRATKQAEEGRTPGITGGTSTVILDRVIGYLQTRAAG